MRLLLILLLAFGGAIPTKSCGAQGAYFESALTGRIDLVDFQLALNCNWGLSSDQAALQRSGQCGLPKQRNDLIVVTHNTSCVGDVCPLERGKLSGIGLLRRGDKVAVFDGSALWQGRVTWFGHVVDQSLAPQAEYDCGAPKCGVAVTSSGDRLPDGRFAYCLVRFALRRAA